MATRQQEQAHWLTQLENELDGLDLWQQQQALTQRIARADAWLARYPSADEIAYQRLEILVARHAQIIEKLRLLHTNPQAELCLLLPPDFGGAVSTTWQRDEQGRLLAWFTRDEFAEALLINSALAELALDSLAVAA
jgi:hypothetical protein